MGNTEDRNEEIQKENEKIISDQNAGESGSENSSEQAAGQNGSEAGQEGGGAAQDPE